MFVTTKVSMDLQHPSHPAVVNAVQGDTDTRKLEIALYSGGATWPIPGNTVIAVRYRKPDGTKGYYDSLPDGTTAYNIVGNVATISLAPQMLTVAGSVTAILEMIQGNHILATFPIQVNVAANPAAGAVASEDYINWLQWMEAELTARTIEMRDSGDFTGPRGERGPQGDPGPVSKVAGVSPDDSGNVPLTADHVGAVPTSGGNMSGTINMASHAITGLPKPTEPTHAASKEYVDAALAEDSPLLKYIALAAPRNFLDNSDFTNPVNQREETTYNLESNGGYTIDLWKAGASSVSLTVGETGITLTGDLCQILEDSAAHQLDGKPVTIAALIDDTLLCASGIVDLSTASTTIAAASPISLTTDDQCNLVFGFHVEASSILKWAALYLGEYPLALLPQYCSKGYNAELRECMRYYQRFSYSNAIHGWGIYWYSDTYSESYGCMSFPLPVAMRPLESWTYDGPMNVFGHEEYYGYSVSRIRHVALRNNGSLLFVKSLLSSNLPADSNPIPVTAHLAYSSPFELSADL